MGSFYRGVRNVFRSRARALAIMVVLGLSVSVALTMSSVEKSVGGRLDALRSDVGTQLELRPAGSYGLAHSSDDKGARYLPGDMVQKAAGIAGVRSTRGYLSMMGDFAGEHVIVMGIEPGARLSIFGGSTGRIVSGELLDSYSNADGVVLIGEGYAKRHKVSIGDTVKLKDAEVKVVGIFSSDTSYGDHGIFVPLGAMQRIFGLEGKLSSVFVDVDSIGNVNVVESQIKSSYEKVDVIDKDKPIRAAVAASLGSVQSTSRMGAALSLGVGSAIVFFTMLLVTRERRREIGTLKAIGASDSDIAKQFVFETLAMAIGAAALGILLTYAGGGYLAASFFPDAGSAAESAQKDMRNVAVYAGSSAVSSRLPAFSFELSSVSYAVGMAFLLGAAGMLYPAVQAFRMKPAEALRHE